MTNKAIAQDDGLFLKTSVGIALINLDATSNRIAIAINLASSFLIIYDFILFMVSFIVITPFYFSYKSNYNAFRLKSNLIGGFI